MEYYYGDKDSNDYLVGIVLLNLIYMDSRIEIEYRGKGIDFIKSYSDFFDIKDNKIKKKEFSEDDLVDCMGNSLNEFLDMVINDAGEDKYLIPYDELSDLIFNYSISDYGRYEDFELVKANGLDTIKDELLTRVNRQIKLCIIQAKTINLAAKEAHETAHEAHKAAKEAQQVKDKIYTDFITILGIFTAITFATFGGLQLIGNVFGNIKKFNLYSVGLDMMLGSILMFGIYIILMALIIGISKLKDKDNEYIINEKITRWILKAFLFVFSVGIILIIIYNIQLLITKKVGSVGWTVSISIVALSLLILAFWYLNKDRDTN